MERTLNKVELRGHVGTDPKVTELEGVTVIRFPLATHEAYKGKDGQYKEETMWHNIAAWSSKGMMDFSNVRKGVFLEVLGKLRYYKWVSKSGEDKYSCEIVALKMSMPEND